MKIFNVLFMNDKLKPPERDAEKLTELLQLQLDRHGEDTAALLEQGLPLSPHVKARLMQALGLSDVVSSPEAVPNRDERVRAQVTKVLDDVVSIPDEEFGAGVQTVVSSRKAAPDEPFGAQVTKLDAVVATPAHAERKPATNASAPPKIDSDKETEEQILQRLANIYSEVLGNLTKDWNKSTELTAHDLKKLLPAAEWESAALSNSALMGVVVGRDPKREYSHLQVILPSYRHINDYGDELSKLKRYYDFSGTPSGEYIIEIQRPAYQIKYSNTISKGSLTFKPAR